MGDDESVPIPPEDDPFACPMCGCYLHETKRIAGEEYCDGCLSSMGFVVEGFE